MNPLTKQQQAEPATLEDYTLVPASTLKPETVILFGDKKPYGRATVIGEAQTRRLRCGDVSWLEVPVQIGSLQKFHKYRADELVPVDPTTAGLA